MSMESIIVLLAEAMSAGNELVLAKLHAYREVGVGAFILSGYTHAAEADLFAKYVLPNIDHGPLYEGSTTVPA